METAWYTVRVPLITRLSLVMRNEHSVWRQHWGSLAVHFSSSRAVFPTLAICLGFVLALYMVRLTNSCPTEITLHIPPQQRVSVRESSHHAVTDNALDSVSDYFILQKFVCDNYGTLSAFMIKPAVWNFCLSPLAIQPFL